MPATTPPAASTPADRHVVATVGPHADVEASARALAGALGLTVFEARTRLATEDVGPAVFGRPASRADADERARALSAAGLEAVVVSMDLEPWFAARTFVLEAERGVFEDASGARCEVPWARVASVLEADLSAGTSIEREVEQRVEVRVGIPSLTGMVRVRRVEDEKVRVVETRERCVLVVGGERPVYLGEQRLRFEGLGEAMAATRTANLDRLAAELAARAPDAVRDAGLRQRATQSRILGPGLPPERHGGLLVALRHAALVGVGGREDGAG